MKERACKVIISISKDGLISLSLDEGYTQTYVTKDDQERIKKYITCFNLFLTNNKSTLEDYVLEKKCHIYVSFYSPSDMAGDCQGFYKMNPKNMAKYCVMVNEEKDKEGIAMTSKERLVLYDAPTIHMTIKNIFAEKDENDNLKEPYKRFARYMDSSIWNYYAPIIVKDESKDGLDPERFDFSYFTSAIQSIINNSFYKTPRGVTNLYEINVTKEYADINERILMQSKLLEVSGHDKNVSPFLFHSEQKVKEETEKKKELKRRSGIKTLKDEILSYKWRILLVDDHATRGLTVGEKDEANLTKLKVIQKELCGLFGAETITTDCQNEKAKIYIECASTLKEAKNKLKEKKYEIILLDYLLGKKGDGREYGYELLKGIWYKENKDNLEKERLEELEKLYEEYVFDYKKGPDNRFYFMFISAFTTAVSERLLAESWARSEEYWYIGEGACPINTPYLFQYRLLHIMEKRMKEMGLKKFNISEWLKTQIYDCDIPRQEARNKFKDVLNFMCEYEQLEKDYSYEGFEFNSIESVMVTNFLGKDLYPKAVFEHVVQLVYLTAFGTVRQWPEMWEEYQFLKSVVGRIEVIEKYIFDLKNNSI